MWWKRGRVTERVPEWTGERKGTRIVIEAGDPSEAWAAGRILERRGYEVKICPGPERLPNGTCAILTDGRCGTIEGADVVVTMMPVSHRKTRDVVQAVRARYPEKPQTIEVTRPEEKEFPEVLRGAKALRWPVWGADLIRAVDQVVASRDGARR